MDAAIVDASVAVKWVIEEEGSAAARQRRPKNVWIGF
jgi:predicted nucleic acid-binding protein